MDNDVYLDDEGELSAQERSRLVSSLSRAEAQLARVTLQEQLLRERCAGLEKQLAAAENGVGEAASAAAAAAAQAAAQQAAAQQRAAASIVASAKTEASKERKRAADLQAQLEALQAQLAKAAGDGGAAAKQVADAEAAARAAGACACKLLRCTGRRQRGACGRASHRRVH